MVLLRTVALLRRFRRRQPVTISLPWQGFEVRATGSWCGRRDLNPHGPCGPTDFHTQLRLSPPPTAFAMGFGVWTIPSPCPDCAPGVRRCPSSLYTFPTGTLIAPAGLGPGSPF